MDERLSSDGVYGHHCSMRGTRLLTRTLELARATAEGVDVLPETLEVLDRHVGASALSVSAMELRPGTDARAEVSLRGAAPMTADELALWPRLMASHPYLPRLVGGPMTASRVTDVVDMRTFERTELYQRLLGPRGSRYQAALVLDRSASSMLLVSLWRAERDFDDREIERLEAVRAVMAAATTFARAVDAARPALRHGGLARGRGVEGSPPGEDRSSLTGRQRQVAMLVEAGLSNDQIARRLGIAPRTVRKHLEDLFDRTGARTRTQVALWWRQGGGTATGPCTCSGTW